MKTQALEHPLSSDDDIENGSSAPILPSARAAKTEAPELVELMRILVVDDQPIIRDPIAATLRAAGYQPLCAANGSKALEILREQPVDLILLDINMPVMDGLTFLRIIRRSPTNAGLPVIMLTGDDDRHDILEAAKLGIRGYVLKSNFSLRDLLTRVTQHFDGLRQASVSSAPSFSRAPDESTNGNATADADKAAAHSPVVARGKTLRHRPVAAEGSIPENHRILVEAANKLGIVLLTRAETLEKLDSAPVKTLPGVVTELISVTNSPRGSVGDLADMLRRDPVMSARVLRVANSAAFTSQRARVSSVEDAVKNIGVTGVRNLLVNVGVFDAFATDPAGSLRMMRVWQHCLGVALLMEKLAPKESLAPPGTGYLIGLCHDLADIVLRQHFAAQYQAAESLMEKTGCSLRAVEAAIFGLPYADLVSSLLARLGLPAPITAPIEEFFHFAEGEKAFGTASTPARTLRAANIYAHGLMLAPGIAERLTPLAKTEIESIFGDVTLSGQDEEGLRGQTMATVGILAGLNSAQIQEMSEPLVPLQPIKIGYVRHREYSALDPLAAFLRLAAREVSLLPPLKALKADSLTDIRALIVAAPREEGAEAFTQELDCLGRLTAGKAMPVLYLSGSDLGASAARFSEIDMHPLPINIELLGQFLAGASQRKNERG